MTLVGRETAPLSATANMFDNDPAAQLTGRSADHLSTTFIGWLPIRIVKKCFKMVAFFSPLRHHTFPTKTTTKAAAATTAKRYLVGLLTHRPYLGSDLNLLFSTSLYN